MSDLLVFLVAPKGKEHLTTVVLAANESRAKAKVLNNPAMDSLEGDPSTLIVLNITDHFLKQGYDIAVSKISMYH